LEALFWKIFGRLSHGFGTEKQGVEFGLGFDFERRLGRFSGGRKWWLRELTIGMVFKDGTSWSSFNRKLSKFFNSPLPIFQKNPPSPLKPVGFYRG